MARLLDLPNELLLSILAELAHTPQELLSLPLLCHRLHFLALPMYFTSMGMGEPTQRAIVQMSNGNSRDSLDALQMASFITSIDNLCCSLPRNGPFEAAETVRHVARVSKLIHKLEFVHEVTIVWAPPNELMQSFEADKDTIACRPLALEMEKLLNCVLEHGCTSLTLQGGMFFPISPRTMRFGTIDAVRTATSKILPTALSLGRNENWIDAQIERFTVEETATLKFDLNGKPSYLSRLNINSSMFLLPPCINWTLSALRSSAISSVSLCGIFLPTKMWAVLLPLIASIIPNLAELSLADLHGLSGTDILVFLTRLPLLKSLAIGYTEYSRQVQSSCPDSAPTPKLENLEHLHAPSTFIVHFLKKKSTLPNLRTLCITPRKLILGYRGLRHIRQFITDIARRLEKHRISPEVTLEMRCGQDMDRDLTADIVEPLGEELARSLRMVTRLVVFLELKPSKMSIAEMGTLARWINRFPGLMYVCLRFDLDNAVEDGVMMDHVRTLSEQNPQVKSFHLNNEAYDPDALLLSSL
ncbi:hypothetical protein MIND_00750300 [Mycena indigotica]|uniref:F-box domain-containing protein n=1 Tax=Mycena indigotica TaxID=2126181 RepID=A0A8H6SN05_9AGAR|nr:uncharacterized protein MIND_00750300 [Mycena indigotica]KAF7301845.1 hypothetical protein MIND_00750300 [Mycena indigotica]